MTTSIAPAPASPAAPLTGMVPEDERDAGIRAFRGLLIASGIAVVFWGLLGLAVVGVVQLFS